MKLLAVGTVVTVTPQQVKRLNGMVDDRKPQYKAVILGYDMWRTKYQVGREIWPGRYAKTGNWIFLHEAVRGDS